MQRILLFCLLLFSSAINAVVFDLKIVDRHIIPAKEALNGWSSEVLPAGYWKQTISVTSCKSGNKYYEKIQPNRQMNLLSTEWTDNGNLVVNFYASQVAPTQSKGNAYIFQVMDNAQSFRTYKMANYIAEDGKRYLALGDSQVFQSNTRSCESITVFEVY